MKDKIKASLVVVLCLLSVALSYKTYKDSERISICQTFAKKVYGYAILLEQENSRIRILYDRCKRSHRDKTCDSMEESKLRIALHECSDAIMNCECEAPE